MHWSSQAYGWPGGDKESEQTPANGRVEVRRDQHDFTRLIRHAQRQPRRQRQPVDREQAFHLARCIGVAGALSHVDRGGGGDLERRAEDLRRPRHRDRAAEGVFRAAGV